MTVVERNGPPGVDPGNAQETLKTSHEL
jgi:hypothetical protein